MKPIIETTLWHFHDGVLSENRKDSNGQYIMEDGCSHLEIVCINGIPKYSRILELYEQGPSIENLLLEPEQR